MIRSIPIILCIALYFSGCAAVGDFGNSLKYHIQGEHYLQKQDFKQGLETFGKAVKIDRKNPEVSYYYGRFLLAENDTKKALPYLKRATVLEPGKSEYHFWLGVAYGESRQESLERKSYLKALELDPKNIQALTYMGNNRLRAKKYAEALKYYRMALELSDSNPQALYNRAVCLRKLGRVSEEKRAWLHYLDIYPSGSFARLAADRLNSLGDQTYRNHRLGLRTLTLAEIGFVPFSDKLSETAYPSLDLVGSTVAKMKGGTLNIIVYQLNNSTLAKSRAITIRDYLTKHFPELNKDNRLQISWFGTTEKRVVLKKELLLKESVQFFLTDFKKKEKISRKK
jgi:tetratricopeptide (TPR) repeat protein